MPKRIFPGGGILLVIRGRCIASTSGAEFVAALGLVSEQNLVLLAGFQAWVRREAGPQRMGEPRIGTWLVHPLGKVVAAWRPTLLGSSILLSLGEPLCRLC